MVSSMHFTCLQDTVSDLKTMQLSKEEQQRRRRVRESTNATLSAQSQAANHSGVLAFSLERMHMRRVGTAA